MTLTSHVVLTKNSTFEMPSNYKYICIEGVVRKKNGGYSVT